MAESESMLDNASEDDGLAGQMDSASLDADILTPGTAGSGTEDQAQQAEASVTVSESQQGLADPAESHAAPRPRFASKCQLGYATEEARKLWMKHKGKVEHEIDEDSLSLTASRDPAKPLYYWQLYSVLGKEKIVSLIRTFYESVYDDEDYPKLKKAFQKVPNTTPAESLDHHIKTQSQYWMDAFGGGKKYHGGFNRLELHHRYNGMEVMNAEAATRWTFHMNRAIQESDLGEDPRVKACLCDFLKTHMDKYGEQFNFKTQQLTFGAVCEEPVRDKRSSRRRDRETAKEEAEVDRHEERKRTGREGGAKKGGSKGRR